MIAEIYQGYGFEPLETPAVENIETLTGKYGEEGDRLIFKILKRGEDGRSGEADLALRYDLTVPLARVVAQYRGALPKYFKRYQIQPVWRADRPQKGRFREFYQCDVDATGSTAMTVEAELLAAGADVLTRLGFTDFTIRLNHRQLLAAMLDAAGVPAALHGTALVSLDKADKIGRDAVATDMTGRGVAQEAAQALVGALFAGPAEGTEANADVLARLGRFAGGLPHGRAAIDELTQILALSAGTAAGASPAARSDAGARARLLHRRDLRDRGGRPGRQPRRRRPLRRPGRDVPGPARAGVRDLAGARAHPRGDGRARHVPGRRSSARRPTCWWPTSTRRRWPRPWPWRRRCAPEPTATRLAVELFPDVEKLGKQFKYAAERGVPFVAVMGEAERSAGTVAIKTLASGEQVVVPRDAAAAHIVSVMRTSRG